MKRNQLKTVAVFQYSSEAHIIKGKLEAEGIETFMFDSYTIDTDPLISNAIGGVKIKVRQEDVIVVKRILDSVEEFSLDDNGNKISCVKCESERVTMFSTINDLKSLLSFLIGFLFGTLPFHTRYKYKCYDCNTEFDLK